MWVRSDRRSLLAVVAMVGALGSLALADTAFTYQGELKLNGTPVNGTADLVVRIFDGALGGTQCGTTQTIPNVTVSAGRFTARIDCGGSFDGGPRWLDVQVRSPAGSGTYTQLSPRQELTATPYANGLRFPFSGGGVDAYQTALIITAPNEYSTAVKGTSGEAGKGVVGEAQGGIGVTGTDDYGTGVHASAPHGTALSADSTYGTGVHATSGGTTATIASFQTRTYDDTPAILGSHAVTDYYGVGVRGIGGFIGVKGDVTPTGAGGYYGVAGSASGGTGTNYGVYGDADDYGVYGTSSGYGVYGYSATGYGVFGTSTSGWPGYFSGKGIAISETGSYAISFLGHSEGGSDTGIGHPADGTITVITDGSERMRVMNNGNVGIGTSAPGARFEVNGGTTEGYVRTNGGSLDFSGGTDGRFGLINTGPTTGATTIVGGGAERLTIQNDGKVGIGTNLPSKALHVVGDELIGWNGARASLYLGDTNHSISAETNGGLRLGTYQHPDMLKINQSGTVDIKGNVNILSATTGNTVLQLGEGLDYAEGFDVSDHAEVGPGTVLVIDPANPGKLMKSENAYDCRVAGIVAGGKELGSGVRLGVGQFDKDVALAGRVYCNVDASYGAIQPGDLLTTSPTPGCAMKVKDRECAQGAILGKAMEGLKDGRGQVLVLVTLQ